ncbi:hypothetical protein [Arenibaculum pallidiluteum]|uniref:hypothetical protein n=1 Tax=Arenibaculum pallidiluteum TaxID=2812559 RepID=UPI001A978B76|nr:hypothetical protein [Arenibaculum pallidiluteum]
MCSLLGALESDKGSGLRDVITGFTKRADAIGLFDTDANGVSTASQGPVPAALQTSAEGDPDAAQDPLQDGSRRAPLSMEGL